MIVNVLVMIFFYYFVNCKFVVLDKCQKVGATLIRSTSCILIVFN